ncbi:hypothetical protein BDZ89DRAFT_1070780 [Hymenopellis radicata]|nr:hypothetical protein BDZ89DRAFT_1073329 [Hymenopellis radicata]KAF9022375.1 hypothetical protein BDZ89DRAFT_1070780 [Hymenopellis radicata]
MAVKRSRRFATQYLTITPIFHANKPCSERELAAEFLNCILVAAHADAAASDDGYTVSRNYWSSPLPEDHGDSIPS